MNENYIKTAKFDKWDKKTRNWFKLLFAVRSSVIPAILPIVFIFGLFGFFVSLIDYWYFDLDIDNFTSLTPSIVLSLLLGFRTNTAYDRYWEGRKLWGSLINTVRNLSRNIWITIEENNLKDREKKVATLRLLPAFAIAMKLHLRAQKVNEELAAVMPEEYYEKLKQVNSPPLEIAFWIGNYLQDEYKENKINYYQVNALLRLLDTMVEILGGCERILKTPIPLVYSIYLRQLSIIYCLSLPFQMVNELGWFTVPILCLVSFTVFGIEEIGIEIENPFGCDPNDLPLDKICQTMLINIEDLISLEPCSKNWDNN